MTFVLDPSFPKKMSFFPLHSISNHFPDPSPPFWTMSLILQVFFKSSLTIFYKMLCFQFAIYNRCINHLKQGYVICLGKICFKEKYSFKGREDSDEDDISRLISLYLNAI